jgi:hypothetical protein
MAPHVRLLAVSFLDRDAARSAATMLAASFDPTEDVQVVPLGQASYPARTRSLVVGHFMEDVIVAVRSAVKDVGGRIEMDVPEDRAF